MSGRAVLMLIDALLAREDLDEKTWWRRQGDLTTLAQPCIIVFDNSCLFEQAAYTATEVFGLRTRKRTVNICEKAAQFFTPLHESVRCVQVSDQKPRLPRNLVDPALPGSQKRESESESPDPLPIRIDSAD
jgi:hypothetical protein